MGSFAWTSPLVFNIFPASLTLGRGKSAPNIASKSILLNYLIVQNQEKYVIVKDGNARVKCE